MKKIPARVRFAPSPTGRMHLGSARTALYDYLLARQTGGQFILRLEDTDQKRFQPGSENELKEGMRWLGIDWDEGLDVGGPHGPYRQSERKEIYLDHAHQLIEKGHAYYCFCTPERLERSRQEQMQNKQSPRYDGTCRNLQPDEVDRRVRNGERHVIRFRIPLEGSISFTDRMRGEITVENKNIDDYILVKSDGLALYHLAAMVDDHLMNITHVIRGSEWLSTFPLHVHIFRAFGWQEPEWVHLSLFLKPSGKGKMSKREAAEAMKDGHSIFIGDMLDLGYLPEAIVNWIALMGWSFDDKTELFTMQELIEKFSLDRLNPAPAAINFSKLDHFNGLHIRSLSNPELVERVKPYFEKAGILVTDEKLRQVTPLIQERLVTLDEAPEKGGFFFQSEVAPEPSDLVIKGLTPDQSVAIACRSLEILKNTSDFSHENAETPLRALAEEFGLSAGQVFGLLRVAITGQTISPPLLESMTVIGKETVLNRLHQAVELLNKMK